MNLANHMIQAGNAYRAYPATALGTTVLHNYGDIANRVSRLAAALVNRYEMQPGDRVALVLENCPEYLELLYAAWHAGLVVVPVNAKLHRKEFAYILKNSAASLCFVSKKTRESIEPLLGETLNAIVDVASDEYGEMLQFEPATMVSRDPDDAAWLFYTSGTTGQPKGAILSHRNLTTMCECYFTDVDPVEPWSAILHAAPMSHGSGLYGLAYVMKGGCHVIPESRGFDVGEVYQLIEHWPGVSFFAAPTMVKRLLDYTEDTDTRNLKAIIYGGGPMYVEDCLAGLERFGFKMTQLYGQGESPMTITALNVRHHADNKHPRYLQRLASVGVAQSAVDVRVADDDGVSLKAGVVGEILVRGASVMSGYWNNPEATAETIRDGWLHTGDYGVFDEDGFLTLKDRAKDLIISGGSNIYPREVEEVLLQHPTVSEVSVIGRPDREWGEVVVAYIVTAGDNAIDVQSLDLHCKNEIARFKRPKHYYQVDSLPKNNYGKVLKTELREYDQGQSHETTE
jgi:long-chain acyl-CoA synthetase